MSFFVYLFICLAHILLQPFFMEWLLITVPIKEIAEAWLVKNNNNNKKQNLGAVTS